MHSTREQIAPPAAHLSVSGLGAALIGFLISLSPSLLPRPPFLMGILSGLVAILGYGFGVAVAQGLHRLGVPETPARLQRRVIRAVLAGVAAVALIGLWVATVAQNEVRGYQGLPPESPLSVVVAGLTAVGLFTAILLVSRALRRLTRRLAGRLAVRLPRAAATGAALLAVAALVVGVLGGIVIGGLKVTERLYADKNEDSADWVEPPTSDLRTGGPGSLVGWDSLGWEGRAFIAGGPTPAQLTAATGRPAVQPIRVYAGLASAGTAQERAALAVAELVRTGAFERPVLVVAGVAGTGWLNPAAVDSLEYVWDGDTAIAATQYSYLPSWISMLVDQEKARTEGRALFDAVWREWSQRPADSRPRLLVYGESLGSLQIQAAFPTADDLAARTDGALLVGTPSMTQPWIDITAGRDPGSPQWQPVVDGGRTVRFSDDGDYAALGDWPAPRVGYLQHANDPVVWWNSDLVAYRPDWLIEPRGPAVSPRMRWIPGITFGQVGVDQLIAVNQKDGFGHNYGAHMVRAWTQVAGTPEGWTDADTAQAEAAVGGG